jgi:prephenate dehydrogenase
METVCIVGVGLIGASFGLALRKSGFTGEIIGVSSPKAIDAGLARGAISCSATLAEAAERADLIYLSQAVDRILDTIPQLAPALRPGTLVTDAGSTKQRICECALAYLPADSFLGGHPIAGKEQRGPEAADADLFRERPYVLTPRNSNNAHVGVFREALNSFGAIVTEITPAEHDAILAFTSHLPQLVSTALAATLYREDNTKLRQIIGSGLIDMTRLALSSPELWSSILETNQTQVSKALDAYIHVLRELQATLGEREIAYTFEQASAFARTIRVSRPT